MSNTISRLEKLEKLNDPYPRDFPSRQTIESVLDSRAYGPDGKQFLSDRLHKIAGRISSRRNHGDNIFFDIFDQTGSIQIRANRTIVSKEDWHKICETDIGDMVGVIGTLGQNPREEPLLLVA